MFLIIVFGLGIGLGYWVGPALVAWSVEPWFVEGLRYWPVLAGGGLALLGGLLAYDGARIGVDANAEMTREMMVEQWRRDAAQVEAHRTEQKRTLALTLMAEFSSMQQRLSGYAIGLQAWHDADFFPSATRLRDAIDLSAPIFRANAHRIGELGPEAAPALVSFHGLIGLADDALSMDAADLGALAVDHKILSGLSEKLEKAVVDIENLVDMLNLAALSSDEASTIS